MGAPGGLALFEELRYVWELMAAELVFLVPFAPRQRGFTPKLVIGMTLLSAFSLLYLQIRASIPYGAGLEAASLAWYLCLAFLTMAYLRLCFEVSLVDALYVAVSAFAAQHVVYVLVHEWLALHLWTWLQASVPVYAGLSAGACAAWYAFLSWAFSPQLKVAGGRLFESSRRGTGLMAELLAVLLACTFGLQFLFHQASGNETMAVVVAVLVCLLVLGLQYATLGATLEGRELAATEQMLAAAEEHWRLSNELVENLNRSVHDLKHVIGALEQLPAADRAGYVSETSEYIRKYERTVYTDDEVLNTILSEKALLCEGRGVAFSCSMGKVDLGFVALPDLYVLLGNLVSNAVEGAETVADPAMRAITIAIRERGGLVCISCDNPYEGERQVGEGGLLATTKADAARHGYGLKSMRAVAEKYGGTLTVAAEDGLFSVQVALPAHSASD